MLKKTHASQPTMYLCGILLTKQVLMSQFICTCCCVQLAACLRMIQHVQAFILEKQWLDNESLFVYITVFSENSTKLTFPEKEWQIEQMVNVQLTQNSVSMRLFVDSGQQWRSMEQRNELHQALDIQTVLVESILGLTFNRICRQWQKHRISAALSVEQE